MQQTMEFVADMTHKPPVFWKMAKYCSSGHTGDIVHFPAGGYRQQMATWWGRLEMDMMQCVRRAEHYVKNRPGLKDLYDSTTNLKFEQYLESDGWKIPQIQKK